MEWEYKAERLPTIEDIAEVIHSGVTIEDALSTYCPSIPRRGHRCPCPIHNGKDFNFSYTDHHFKCFVCNSSGDVISLVKEVCELSTRLEAMKRICSDFRLGVDFRANIPPEVSVKVNKARAEAEAKRKAREEWEEKYARVMDEWVAEDLTVLHTPPDSNENIAKICQAKQRREWLGYRLDQLLLNEPR